jgi:Fe-S-cluster-containing hydrogenase component 2
MLKDLESWMEKHDYSAIDDFRSCALSGITAFQDLRSEPLVASLEKNCFRGDCSSCLNACTYDAIERQDGKITLISKNCFGCGICVDLCPEKIISLAWNEGL